jgi:hypothetical protein
MASTHSNVADRIKHSIRSWLALRFRECTQCRECDCTISPWEPLCPHCGCGCPARVSKSAAVVLFGGFAVLLLLGVLWVV